MATVYLVGLLCPLNYSHHSIRTAVAPHIASAPETVLKDHTSQASYATSGEDAIPYRLSSGENCLTSTKGNPLCLLCLRTGLVASGVVGCRKWIALGSIRQGHFCHRFVCVLGAFLAHLVMRFFNAQVFLCSLTCSLTREL